MTRKCLKRTLVAVFLTEHRCRWQRQLHDITTGVVLQHHSQTLLITASAAITLTRTGLVLWARQACLRLFVSRTSIRLLAIVRPAIRCRCSSILIVCTSVKNTADLGCSFNDNHIKVTVFDGGNLLTTGHQTEHAALN